MFKAGIDGRKQVGVGAGESGTGLFDTGIGRGQGEIVAERALDKRVEPGVVEGGPPARIHGGFAAGAKACRHFECRLRQFFERRCRTAGERQTQAGNSGETHGRRKHHG
ncbi:hypothetical protein T35B1_13628 [Salinisphaera shabanensis T35B1]|uniref:hypothetical protein n=1 Tax=Salinisphaera shabanensis TaxID=180542 RepID=UPI0033406E98